MEGNWIEEQSACQASGISRSTLLRFAEAGYLKTKQGSSGSPLYDPSEISQVFGIEITKPMPKPVEASSQLRPEVAQQTTSVPPPTPTEKPLPDFIPEASLAAQVVVTSDNVANAAPEDVASVGVTPAPSEQKPATTTDFEPQRQKLVSTIELLEKLLQGKESEVEDLKQQRTWLRERIQRLEEKSDRDQLLLLAETQTLRRLIEIQAPKKSIVERTLLALGFLPTPEEGKTPDGRKTFDQ